jgi:hypothetical protein
LYYETFTNSKKSKEVCYYTNYDLNNINCSDFNLEIKYENNNKLKSIKRTFIEQKPSKLVNHVLNQNYQQLSPTDISYYLIMQGDISTKTSKETELIYQFLKNERNNDYKCWPKNVCSIQETAEILVNLVLAEYDENSRLIFDGQKYLERYLIEAEEEEYDLDIYVTHDWDGIDDDEDIEINCTIKLDNEDEEVVEFDDNNDDYDGDIKNEVELSCDGKMDEIKVIIDSKDTDYQRTEIYEESSGFTIDLTNYVCVAKENYCNFDYTLDTMFAFHDDIDDKDLIHNYIDAYLIEKESETYLKGTTAYSEMGKFIFYKDNGEVENYLKYKQNNDGSWGTGSKYDKIAETAWAVIGLQKSDKKSENTEDAEKWIYYNEPNFGWGSIEKNTLAYFAIKEKIKPYLSINTRNYIPGYAKFNIINPTIYNLRKLVLNFDDEISPHIFYTQDLGDLDGENNKTFEVRVNENFFGEKTGMMKITGIDTKGKTLTLVNIPIKIKSQMPFEVSNEDVLISKENPEVLLNIVNITGTYDMDCTIKTPFSEDEEINIKESTKTVVLKNPDAKTGSFEISFDCYSGNANFIYETPIFINFTKESFEVENATAKITDGKDFYVKVISTYDERQTINAEISGFLSNYVSSIDEDKMLAKNDSREIYFKVSNYDTLKTFGNLSGKIKLISSTGYTQEVDLLLRPGEEKKESSNLLWYIIFGVAAFIIILVILGYFRKKQLEKEEEQNQEEQEESGNEEDMIVDIDF